MAFRYLVFGFLEYYPGGGMEDCKLKTNEIETVKAFLKSWSVEVDDYENVHVYDAEKDELIYKARYVDEDAGKFLVEVNKL